MCRPLRLSAAVLLVMSGCAHAVRVESDPPGAEVMLDGVKIGYTPVDFTDEGSTGHTYLLELEKPGYREKRVRLKQDVKGMRAGLSVITGFVFAFPLLGLLWSWELPEEKYTFSLEPDGSLPLHEYERIRQPTGGKRNTSDNAEEDKPSEKDLLD